MSKQKQEQNAEQAEADRVAAEQAEAERVAAEQAEAERKPAKPADRAEESAMRIYNLRKNPMSIAGVKIPPNGHVDLTEKQCADGQLMAKISHGIDIGVLGDSPAK